jgi:antitoxin (DNA-binding transcriptional repressor) of toxin-antitoxin stability system
LIRHNSVQLLPQRVLADIAYSGGIMLTDTQLKEAAMPQVTITDAQAHLPDIIHQLSPGEEIVITENNLPIAKLIAAVIPTQRVPKLGTQRGSVAYMAPDFDAPLDDFQEYMP